MLDDDATVEVIVKVALAADSSVVVTSLILSSGPASSSAKVIVTCCVPLSVADPPETLETSIMIVSSPSKVLSSVGVIFIEPVVEPAAIVKLEALML